MNWEEVFVVGGLTAGAAGAVQLAFMLLIRHAQKTMGIAAGPKVAALNKQRGLAVVTAAVVMPAVLGGMAMSGRTAGKPISWQDYVSEQGAYAAQFPGETRESQQAVAGPDGTDVTLHLVETDLGNNGHYGVIEREGPELTYEGGDRRQLYEIDEKMLTALKAAPYDQHQPYPAAWGEVACTELRGHPMQDAEQEIIIRSWRTGAHQYSAVASYRKGAKSEAVAQQFLNSIRPTGDYKKPPSLSSGVE